VLGKKGNVGSVGRVVAMVRQVEIGTTTGAFTFSTARRVRSPRGVGTAAPVLHSMIEREVGKARQEEMAALISSHLRLLYDARCIPESQRVVAQRLRLLPPPVAFTASCLLTFAGMSLAAGQKRGASEPAFPFSLLPLFYCSGAFFAVHHVQR